jgi:hypothetical protein
MTEILMFVRICCLSKANVIPALAGMTLALREYSYNAKISVQVSRSIPAQVLKRV